MAEFIKKNFVVIAIVLLIGIGIGYPVAKYTTPAKITEREVEVPVPPLTGDIKIGFILGSTAEIDTSVVAANIALEEINDYVIKIGLPVTFKILVEDAEGSAVKAFEKFETLYTSGVKIITGFGWSSHVKSCMTYADENHILVLSISSGAPALAIPNDFTYRLNPPDTATGLAYARMYENQGIKALVVLQRADPWGDGLYQYISNRFEELGGTIFDHIRYDPEKSEFSTELDVAEQKIREAIVQYGEDNVALQMISIDEIAVLQSQAAVYPNLMNVLWFGSSPRAQLIKEAGDLALITKCISAMPGITETQKYNDFYEKYYDKTGQIPPYWAVSSYDCLWILAKAILEADSLDPDIIKEVLPMVASSYYGPLGWCGLDENGDKFPGNYDIWAVVEEEGIIDFKKVGNWNYATDEIVMNIP